MATPDSLSAAEIEFLSKCEEELKDRFTDKDEAFMKVFNAEPPMPPIIESWWVPSSGRRSHHRSNRRSHPYERHGNRDGDYQNRRDDYNRGYNDYSRRYNDRDQGYNQRPRY